MDVYFRCDKCGERLKDSYKRKDGSVMSLREYQSMSMKQTGKTLCKKCLKEYMAAERAGQ